MGRASESKPKETWRRMTSVGWGNSQVGMIGTWGFGGIKRGKCMAQETSIFSSSRTEKTGFLSFIVSAFAFGCFSFGDG